MGPLWVDEGYFGVILVRFQKTLIFPIGFNDFMQLYGQLGSTLGALGGHFGITLGALGWLGVTCGSLWDHFGHMMRICAGLIGLKSENMHATAARSKSKRATRTPGKVCDPPSRIVLRLSEVEKPRCFVKKASCLC